MLILNRAMLLRLYNDETPLIDHNYIKQLEKEKKRANTSEPENEVENKEASGKDIENAKPEDDELESTAMDVDQNGPKA
jgi:hypothetical protein